MAQSDFNMLQLEGVAYAEHYGLEQIISEDFQHERLYGSVRATDPFL